MTSGHPHLPISIPEAEVAFHSMLADAGIDPRRLDYLATWEVFKSFARIPIDSPSDGFLFQAGVYTFDGSESFTVDFLRQFEAIHEDEHEHYEQLDCEFLFEATHHTGRIGSVIEWCFPSSGSSLLDWFSHVEAGPAFEFSAGAPPLSSRIFQETV